MKLTLGFSTCPNDTFIFDAAVHKKIDTYGIDFEVFLADVEELNNKAFAGELDITKLSYHAFAYAAENYKILNSGGALGNNNGPLLISKRNIQLSDVNNLKIAIPGKFTTANLLLGIAFPNATNKQNYLFSDIEQAVINQEVDAGLIIHENRFTYENKGLKKIIDLGEFWQAKTNLPIPLGCIAVNKKLETHIQQKINLIIVESINYAYKNPESSLNFIKKYAAEMNPEIMQKHINLYVNEYSKNLGKVGKNAVLALYDYAYENSLIPNKLNDIFVI